jgi:hypothetical protein
MINLATVLIAVAVVVVVVCVVVGVAIGLGQVAWQLVFPLNARTFDPIVRDAAARTRAEVVTPIPNGFRLVSVRGDRSYVADALLLGRKAGVLMGSHYAFPPGWVPPDHLAHRLPRRIRYDEWDGLGVVPVVWDWSSQLLFDADELTKMLEGLIAECDAVDAVLATVPHALAVDWSDPLNPVPSEL